jgi:hypothetical protein
MSAIPEMLTQEDNSYAWSPRQAIPSVGDIVDSVGRFVSPDEAQAMNVGKYAKGFQSLQGKFSMIHDKQLRAEISDALAKLIHTPYKNEISRIKLKDILQHDELYKQYPELKDMIVQIRPFLDKDMAATYRPEIKSYGDWKGRPAEIGLNSEGKITIDDILHEIQHHIQVKEGFERGSTSSKAGDMEYFMNMGEREARDAEYRRMLSSSERLSTPHMRDPLDFSSYSHGYPKYMESITSYGNPVNSPGKYDLLADIGKSAAAGVAIGGAAMLGTNVVGPTLENAYRSWRPPTPEQEALQDAPNPVEYMSPVSAGTSLARNIGNSAVNFGTDMVLDRYLNNQ